MPLLKEQKMANDKVNDYDVIVIGAGPAGSCAAYTASAKGVKVLLADSRAQPGTPIQCAEYVPTAVARYVPLVPGAVIQRIDKLVTYIYDEKASVIKSPGYILNRSIFDASLTDQAHRSGTHLWLQTRAFSHIDNEVQFKTANGGILRARGKIIIGADGPVSTVGKWMKSTNSDFMVGLQWRMPLWKPHYSTDVYLDPKYRGGYAWLFPRGNEANVGVGVHKGYHYLLPGLVKSFVQNLIDRSILYEALPSMHTGGLIPVGGPLTISYKNNMLLCGDAAGLTHAVTGGGIMNAIVSGIIAGDTAVEAIQSKDMKILQSYQDKWNDLLGNFLNKAAVQRRMMSESWSDQTDEFTTLMKKTWIGF
ncbi:MAG TPA: NAD(P)/FAD-dependent oxidoreductase [Syntrophomonadaceae bacterium]|nr:NAD(P)/FAD-dependent oxidoreductase [Syntrophomonadaceae bacterium]